MQICAVTPDTLSLLERVAPNVFDAPIDEARARIALADKNTLLFIAREEDGLVIGQSLGYVLQTVDREPSLLIENLGVTPTARRAGIGRALLKAICAAGEALGAGYMWLGSDPESATADAFYDGIGLPLQQAQFVEVDLPLVLNGTQTET